MKKNTVKCGWLWGALALLLVGCDGGGWMAPVVDSSWRSSRSNAIRHVVSRGETLYAIAFRYDQDYRQLAVLNHLRSPYIVKVGQILILRPGIRPQPARAKTYNPPRAVPIIAHHRGWLWPVQGRIVSAFNPLQGKKGIEIAGKKGDVIRASSAGIVAYAGNGLPRYGNLIIIKHNNQFLTAYGNNLRNMVKEGQRIQAGQVIAEMGLVDRRFWGLHFEIRQAGQPVNPLRYL